ncbi:MAG: hypothetical protein NUW02_01550 [Candidatus Campbellbacteria bacterium]|nr:hypothetical protein [Candidatus Campbellbacteria bacterium]
MKKLIAFLMVVGILLSATPALAESDSSSPRSNGKIVDLTCMQTAVEKRENTIITAWDTLHTTATTALKARRDALVEAWKIEDRKERNAAIKAAWKSFKDAKKGMWRTWNSARKSAWKTFKTDAKACRATDTGSESESADNV